MVPLKPKLVCALCRMLETPFPKSPQFLATLRKRLLGARLLSLPIAWTVWLSSLSPAMTLWMLNLPTRPLSTGQSEMDIELL